MKIQFNTDKNIEGKERLEKFASEQVKNGLKHFVDKITRIEIHLSDQNATKGGADDMQCTLEARLEGLKPIAVMSKNSTKEKALDDAIEKMKAALSNTLGKIRSR
jgi:hypothetical protein